MKLPFSGKAAEQESAEAGRKATGLGKTSGNSVRIGQSTLAVGLTWVIQQDPTVSLQKEARHEAQSEDYSAEVFVLREGTYAQYGLGYIAQGHRPGQKAGAIALAQNFSGSWIAAFELGDLYWVVVARDELILAQGDAVFQTREEAVAFFREFFEDPSLGDWDSVVAPKSWEIPGTDEVDLLRLLEGSARIPTLRRVRLLSGLRTRHVLVVGSVVLTAAGLYAFFAWQEAVERQREAELLEQMQEQERLAAIRRQQVEERVFDLPTETRPDPSSVLATCIDGFLQHTPLVAGWSIEGFTCNGNSANVNLLRQSGNVALLGDLVEASGSKASLSVRENGERVVMSLSLDGGDVREEGERLTFRDLSSLLVQYAQEYEADFTTSKLSPVEYAGDDASSDPGDPIIKYYQANWSVQTDIMPTGLAKILTGVGGVDLQLVEFTSNGGWRLAGTFYQR